MSLTRISGPPELVVSLAEAKAQLRVAEEDTDQDAMIAGHLRAAQDSIDGASSWLGRCLTTQQWRLTLDAFPVCEVIQIPLPPLQSIDAVSYIDDDGATQTIADYLVFGIGASWPARLAHAWGGRWPSTRSQGDAVSVTFSAGYGGFSDVPESVRAAVVLIAQGLYDNCSNDATVTALLAPHRIW